MIYLIYVYLNMKSNLLNVSKKRMLYRFYNISLFYSVAVATNLHLIPHTPLNTPHSTEYIIYHALIPSPQFPSLVDLQSYIPLPSLLSRASPSPSLPCNNTPPPPHLAQLRDSLKHLSLDSCDVYGTNDIDHIVGEMVNLPHLTDLNLKCQLITDDNLRLLLSLS